MCFGITINIYFIYLGMCVRLILITNGPCVFKKRLFNMLGARHVRSIQGKSQPYFLVCSSLFSSQCSVCLDFYSFLWVSEAFVAHVSD